MRRIMECADLANKYIDEKAPGRWLKTILRRQEGVLCGIKCVTHTIDLFIPSVTDHYSQLFAFLNLPNSNGLI